MLWYGNKISYDKTPIASKTHKSVQDCVPETLNLTTFHNCAIIIFSLMSYKLNACVARRKGCGGVALQIEEENDLQLKDETFWIFDGIY